MTKNKFKIFLSSPMSTPLDTVKSFYKRGVDLGAEVIYWNRQDRYDLHSDLQECDAFVLLLPNNLFSHTIRTLPIGCRSELKSALDYKKPIYIGYKSFAGVIQFYTTTLVDGDIRGVTGSYAILPTAIKEFKDTIIAAVKISEDCEKVLKTLKSENPCMEITTVSYPSNLLSSFNERRVICDIIDSYLINDRRRLLL